MRRFLIYPILIVSCVNNSVPEPSASKRINEKIFITDTIGRLSNSSFYTGSGTLGSVYNFNIDSTFAFFFWSDISGTYTRAGKFKLDDDLIITEDTLSFSSSWDTSDSTFYDNECDTLFIYVWKDTFYIASDKVMTTTQQIHPRDINDILFWFPK